MRCLTSFRQAMVAGLFLVSILPIVVFGEGWLAGAESPGGVLTVEFRERETAALEYRLLHGSTPVLDWSPLGLTIRGISFGNTPVKYEWEAPAARILSARLVHGKFREASRRARAGTLHMETAGGERLSLEWLLFDDAFAFRYRLGTGVNGFVASEETGFRLPAGGRAWLGEAERPAQYQPNGQPTYHEWTVGNSSTTADSFYFPALFQLDDGDTWVFLHEANLDRNYVGSRLAARVDDRTYRIKFPNPLEGDARLPFRPAMAAFSATPWRLVVAGSLGTVVETPLVELLSDPPDPELFTDTAWIQPGRVAWSWWSQDTGTPALQRAYIDFAAAQEWDYVLIDAGWTNWPNADEETRALVDFADGKGVGIFLWYNSGGSHASAPGEPRDRLNTRASIDAEFARLQAWGVRGVKVDYFLSDKQTRIQQYLNILESAAVHRLLVNFHGATVPRGWQRTYPNLLTVEAVHGAEMYKWPPGPSAAHNVHLAFTRGVVGPMDYTPMTFQAALTGAGISYAHQLALGVIFQSSLQHWADRADGSTTAGYGKLFADFPETADFLRMVPVTWDETRFLHGHPESHAVLARRSGPDWWIGAITRQGRALALETDPASLFRRPGRLRIYHRGAGAATIAMTETTWSPGETIALSAGGADGQVFRFEPDLSVSFWSTDPLVGDWRSAPGFGWVYDAAFPFVFLPAAGWLYTYPESYDAEWFWSPSLGWLWARAHLFPWVWSSIDGWIYLES